jgi:hypothetical protein
MDLEGRVGALIKRARTLDHLRFLRRRAGSNCWDGRLVSLRPLTVRPCAELAFRSPAMIANFYFIPDGCSSKPERPTHSGQQLKLANAIHESFVGQFSPGTIGNIIGGAVMVAAVYRFVYSSKQGSFLGKM